MKSILSVCLFVVFGLVINSCGSGAKEEPKVVSINDLHKSLSEDKDGKIKAFYEKIGKLETLSKSYSFKPESNSGGSKKIELNFEGKKVVQVIPIPKNYSKTIPLRTIIFGSQLSLLQFREAIENPVESFMPNNKEEGRVKELSRLNETVSNFINSAEYFMVLITKKNKAPIWQGSTYVSGEFEGKIVIFDWSNSEFVASLDVVAVNSTSVSAGNFKNLGDAANADFIKNINKAIETKLKSAFKLKGKPSGLMQHEVK